MQDIHDIKPIIELALLSRTEKIILLLVLLLAIGVLVSWAAYKILKKYAAGNEVEEEVEREEELDYTKIFKTRLDKCSRLLPRGKYKDFHLCLSRAVKEYIGYKRKFRALDMTTAEILRHLRAFPNDQQKVAEFFSLNDSAKYAGRGLEEKTARLALEYAQKL